MGSYSPYQQMNPFQPQPQPQLQPQPQPQQQSFNFYPGFQKKTQVYQPQQQNYQPKNYQQNNQQQNYQQNNQQQNYQQNNQQNNSIFPPNPYGRNQPPVYKPK